MDSKTTALIAAVASAALFILMSMILGIEKTRIAAPAFVAIPAAAYFKGKEVENPFKIGAMLNEAPVVVNMMSAVLSSGRSLEAAIREISEKGPTVSSKLFSSIVNEVDSRVSSDLRDSFHKLLSKMPVELGPYRRSMYMVVSASDTGDTAERSRILKEATDVALQGLKQAGEEYSSKLQSPCMAIFALGIMAPMILLSIVPLLNIGGSLGTDIGIGGKAIQMLILVVVPACVAVLMISVKGKNPMSVNNGDKGGWWRIFLFFSAIPVYIVLNKAGFKDQESIVIAAVIASIIVFITVLKPVTDDKKRRKIESSLKDALFDLGNRLVTGENFESALSSALSSRKDCNELYESFSRELVLCRGDVIGAIRLCFDSVSIRISTIICDVYATSSKNLAESGRLATAAAHQLQDQDSVRKETENKLRSLSDMMTGTAAIFAPLVLGMSMMMLNPISGLAEGLDLQTSFTVISIYLCELAFMMSGFSSLLSDKFDAINVAYKVSIVLPVAMIVLLICSKLTF